MVSLKSLQRNYLQIRRKRQQGLLPQRPKLLLAPFEPETETWAESTLPTEGDQPVLPKLEEKKIREEIEARLDYVAIESIELGSLCCGGGRCMMYSVCTMLLSKSVWSLSSNIHACIPIQS